MIYIFVALLFSFLTSANFFIRTGFFATATSTDLTLLFSAVPYISIILLPALCYKNYYNLYSQFIPQKNIEKIVRRFLFLLIIYSLMVLTLIFPCIFVSFTGNIDEGQIFTSIICLIFYGACGISFCLLIGELISNPVVNFVVSALILAIINSSHQFVTYLNPNPFFANILKYLSFAWHFDAASKGVLDTRDLFYFAFTTIFLILLTDFVTEIKKGRIFSKNRKYRNIITVILYVLLMLNTQNIYKRFDLSKSKKYSLTKFTKEITQKLDSNCKITYYRSSNLLKYYPQIRDVADFLKIYAAQNRKINFVIKNPDSDSSIKSLLNDYGIKSQQLKSVKNNSTEFIDVYSAITIEYEGQTQLIPFTMDCQTLEYDLDGRLNHLVSDRQRIVNIVIGNGMDCTNDYSYLIPWLNSQGFVCNELNIYSSNFSNELENCSGPLLVIGDSEISIDNAIAIENYILSEKGNGFFAVSPYSVKIEDDWSITENSKQNIINMLDNWGVAFNPSVCADLSCSRIQMYSQDENDYVTQNNVHTEILNYPLWIKIPSQINFNSGLTAFWACPIEITTDNLSLTPYLYTSSSSYKYDFNFENYVSQTSSLVETNPFVLRDNPLQNKAYENQIVAVRINGKIKGYYNTASAQNSDIIVYTDQYFVNTLMTGYNGLDYQDYRNFDFLTNCLLKLNGEEELAVLQNKKAFDNSLNKISDVLQYIRLQNITYIVLFLIIPAFFIASALFLQIKNKNRYKKYRIEK